MKGKEDVMCKSKIKIRCKIIVLSVLVLTLGMGVSTTHASTWTNATGDDDWFNPDNWGGGDMTGGPGEVPDVTRSNGCFVGPVPLNFNSVGATSMYMIANNEVTISGGDLTYTGDGLWGCDFGDGLGYCRATQTGGTVTQTGGGAGFLIGHNLGDANNPSTYSISGGQLITERGCTSLTIDFLHDGNPSNMAELNISGDAVVDVRGILGLVMGPQGTLNVSGGGRLIWRDHTLEDLEGDIDFLTYSGPRIDPNAVINALAIQVGEDVHFIDPDRENAKNPNPANNATDVVRDVVLSWLPGQFANTHDVYFGTDFNDVNNADRTNPLDVLAGQDHDATTYELPVLLEFGQTYYWRVDEVNAPPDSTIFKGHTWTFTVEPVAYPIAPENITATASSSSDPNNGPEKTVDGSGLDDNDLHSAEDTDMWLSSDGDPNAARIQYEFDRVYKLHQMLVWNHNSIMEPGLGLGCKDVTIEYSVDGNAFTTLGTAHEFAQAPGEAGYAANTMVELGGVAAKYVRITANSNWGEGLLQQYGLSEVRFSYIPVWAREPDPASGATDMDMDNVTLNWRAGREGASHEVYLSTDPQAVIDETISPVSVPAGGSYTHYDTGELDLGATYYWKVNEVNEAETPTTWPGDLWHFATLECLVVDDIELYNYLDPGDPDSNRIYTVWTDGYENPVNGSILGRPENPLGVPFTERTNVHGGRKAMSLIYDNSTSDFSEVTTNVADLQAGRDWSRYGIQTLSLWFYGDPCNVAQQMYVTLNGSKVLYDRDADNITRIGWQPWNIELVDFGVNLGNVTELGLGLEPIGATGGSGVVYFDDFRLYAYSRVLITPVSPSDIGLVAHYALDGNADDSSGNGHHGTTGDPNSSTPEWVPGGQIGGAVDVDGVADEIDCGNVNVTTTGSISVACWAKPRNIAANFSGIVSKWGETDNTFWLGQHLTDGWMRFGLYLFGGIAETFLDAEEIVLVNDQWSHIVWTYDGHHQKIYVNGLLVATGEDLDTPLTNYEGTLRLGNVPGGSFFDGLIDDVRIYERALSDAEVAGLAGRTEPFDKPF